MAGLSRVGARAGKGTRGRVDEVSRRAQARGYPFRHEITAVHKPRSAASEPTGRWTVISVFPR